MRDIYYINQVIKWIPPKGFYSNTYISFFSHIEKYDYSQKIVILNMTIWIWLFFWKLIEYDYLQYDYYFRKSKIWLFAIWLFFEKNEEIWLFAIRVIFLVSTIIGLFAISGAKHRFPVLFFPAFYWQNKKPKGMFFFTRKLNQTKTPTHVIFYPSNITWLLRENKT